MKRQETLDYFRSNPVFTLDQAARELDVEKAAMLERVKYHLQTGRLKPLARELYAVVPAGVDDAAFQPDPLFVAYVLRSSAIFSHHSALRLLGVAYSSWNRHTAYLPAPRRPLELNATEVKFLSDPKPFAGKEERLLGVRKVAHRNLLLKCTGPERTLVEGFRKPELAGGLEELVRSAAAFSVLDLELLDRILGRYDMRTLWAACGWFLEHFQRTFHVPQEILRQFERRRPASPHYVPRGQRGGTYFKRWNLILPKEIEGLGEPDDSGA